MGKSSRRADKGSGTKNAVRFVCGHCPGMSYPWHARWNDAVRDWNNHNVRYHRRCRNAREGGFQEIEGTCPVPAIVRAFA